MPIQGLTNQWATYDALLDRYAALPDDEVSLSLIAKFRMIRELLANLHVSTNAIVYVGTSHTLMNFGTCDALTCNDRTQPFAFVDVVANKTSVEYSFRVEIREIVHDRPTSKWIVYKAIDTEDAARMVCEALSYADIPVVKLGSMWTHMSSFHRHAGNTMRVTNQRTLHALFFCFEYLEVDDLQFARSWIEESSLSGDAIYSGSSNVHIDFAGLSICEAVLRKSQSPANGCNASSNQRIAQCCSNQTEFDGWFAMFHFNGSLVAWGALIKVDLLESSTIRDLLVVQEQRNFGYLILPARFQLDYYRIEVYDENRQ
jgi:hypothetical protein